MSGQFPDKNLITREVLLKIDLDLQDFEFWLHKK